MALRSRDRRQGDRPPKRSSAKLDRYAHDFARPHPVQRTPASLETPTGLDDKQDIALRRLIECQEEVGRQYATADRSRHQLLSLGFTQSGQVLQEDKWLGFQRLQPGNDALFVL